MTFPAQSDIEIPLLKVIQELGGAAKPKDICPKVAEFFPDLTPAELEERLSSSPSTKRFANLVQWAREALRKKGQLDGSTKGIWKISPRGLERIRSPKEFEHAQANKNIEGVLKDILANYQDARESNSKTSNPYFYGIRYDIRQVFKDLGKHYGLSMKPLGGHGASRRVPYITFLAERHSTSRGVYPIISFDFDNNRIKLLFGSSDDNQIPDSLSLDLKEYLQGAFPEWEPLSREGFPGRYYSYENIREQILQEDLDRVFRAYLGCLEEHKEEFDEFFSQAERKETSDIPLTWSHEESILVLDLYINKAQRRQLASSHDDVVELSRALSTHWHEGPAELRSTVRSPASVSQLLGNFKALDGSGDLSGVGSSEREVWQRYAHDAEQLAQKAQELYAQIGVDQDELAETERPPGSPYSVDDAMDRLFMEEDEFVEILNALEYKKNIILQGPPGVGKTYLAKHLAYCLMKEKADSRLLLTQFHQSYSYEDFIQGYRPTKDGHFERKDGNFLLFCKRAKEDPESKYVVVIDEINRGNLSKIFGELMMLIESDKRTESYALRLAYLRISTLLAP
jgi:hypothetical protein